MATDRDQARQLRLEIADRNAEHEPEYWLVLERPLSESEMREMVAGRTPEWIRDACRLAVDWTPQTGPLSYVDRREVQQRRAARPVRPKGAA